MRIVARQRNNPHWASLYAGIVDIKDYFMVSDGQEYHIGGIALASTGTEMRRQRRQIAARIRHLIANGGRYIVFYCHSGQKDPYDFARWIKEKGYHFNDCYRFEKSLNSWEFWGNLAEVSCAFHYRIFDPRLARNLRAYIYRNFARPRDELA